MSSASSKFYSLEPQDKTGKAFPFKQLEGKVVLIVNVASKCVFTPQYARLEYLYKKYKDEGLVILGFPCNQFLSQEPGSDEQIDEFCKLNYDVTFPVLKKIDVNGNHVDPVYEFLKNQKPSNLGLSRIMWNFEKFLVDKQGNVAERYSSMVKPRSIESKIKELLGKLEILNDSKGSPYNVKFAPPHLGHRLATIGNDGVLRVYDALEPSDLRTWTLTSEINVLPVDSARHLQSDFCLSWCPSRFSTEKLAVSVLDQALIYQREKDNQLHVVAKLEGHNGLIRSVSWAPSIGRWYQLVATGCKDGKVRIFKLTEREDPNISDSNASFMDDERNDDETIIASSNNLQEQTNRPFSSYSPLQVDLIGEHDDHEGEVWSVSWDLTGTILSSASDDGKVRLWKATHSNEFKCISVINAH